MIGWLRLAWRILLIALGLLACLPLHYACKLIRGRSTWPRRYLFWVGHVAGLRIRTSGQPLRGNVLFVANHVSWLDIMAVAGTTGAAFVSKDEVLRWPVIGWLARLNDTVFIARTERGAVRGQADALREALAAGRPVALFPEGTTDGGRDVLPFRASLLASLFPPLDGLKVQPIALDYADAHEIAWVGVESAAANTRRILSRRGTLPLLIHFLEPVDPTIAADRKQLAARSRAEVVEALGAASEPLVDRL